MKPGVVAAALAVLASASVLASAGPSSEEFRPPAEVVRYAGADGTLSARAAWAMGEAARARSGEFWVGYAFSRPMDRRSFIGSVDTERPPRNPTVREVLAGRWSAGAPPKGEEGDVSAAARRALDRLEAEGEPEAKVPKDIGIFLLCSGGGKPSLTRVRMSGLDMVFDFKGLPLYWLGTVSADESLDEIERLFAGSRDDKVRRQLTAAAGIHPDPRRVVPFLERILTGAGPDQLRKEAAFWIGQQDDPAGLRLLVRTARTDRSAGVRESAVFGISQVGLPEAIDELIDLARHAAQADVRKQAVFWIGQAASKKAAPALEDFATGGGDIEIQEQAVFALSQLPENGGVEPLIRLAKTHPDPRIRKKAVFWLGECKDPRALETLIEIVKGK